MGPEGIRGILNFFSPLLAQFCLLENTETI